MSDQQSDEIEATDADVIAKELPTAIDTPLTAEDKRLLEACEVTIEAGLSTFIDVGNALRLVNERLLYRDSADTFAEYVKARFDISRIHAYRQMRASEVVKVLLPLGNIPPPTRETQVRPLTKLKDKQSQKTAWARAYRTAAKVNGVPKVTESVVEAVVADFFSDNTSKSPKPSKRKSVSVLQLQQLSDIGAKLWKLLNRSSFEVSYGDCKVKAKELLEVIEKLTK